MSASAILLENTKIQYDDRVIFDNISIDIPKNKVTVIMGPSGIGKSSLLRILSNQHSIQQGDLYINSKNTKNLNSQEEQELQLNIGFLFQHSALLLNLSVYENIALPIRYHHKLPENIIEEIVDMKLHAVNLSDAKELHPHQLSGGMARRAALARAIALDPPFLFCDEPFSGQDPINAKYIADLIVKLNQQLHATSVLISHEAHLCLPIADHVILLNKNEIVTSGSPRQICHKPSEFTKTFLGPEIIKFYGKSAS